MIHTLSICHNTPYFAASILKVFFQADFKHLYGLAFSYIDNLSVLVIFLFVMICGGVQVSLHAEHV